MNVALLKNEFAHGTLIAVDPSKHFDLFKSLYFEARLQSDISGFSTVIDYESAMLDPNSVWRMYQCPHGDLAGLTGFHGCVEVHEMGDRSNAGSMRGRTDSRR